MSEKLHHNLTPQERVFGSAFNFGAGAADEQVQSLYIQERSLQVSEGEIAWLARTLDGEGGVCADLYQGGSIAATLDFEYELGTATVWVTEEVFGDTALCENVSFDEAVQQAEQFANENHISSS